MSPAWVLSVAVTISTTRARPVSGNYQHSIHSFIHSFMTHLTAASQSASQLVDVFILFLSVRLSVCLSVCLCTNFIMIIIAISPVTTDKSIATKWRATINYTQIYTYYSDTALLTLELSRPIHARVISVCSNGRICHVTSIEQSLTSSTTGQADRHWQVHRLIDRLVTFHAPCRLQRQPPLI